MVSSGSFRKQNHKRKELPDNTWIDSGNYPTKAENFRKDHPAGSRGLESQKCSNASEK